MKVTSETKERSREAAIIRRMQNRNTSFQNSSCTLCVPMFVASLRSSRGVRVRTQPRRGQATCRLVKLSRSVSS